MVSKWKKDFYLLPFVAINFAFVYFFHSRGYGWLSSLAIIFLIDLNAIIYMRFKIILEEEDE